MRNFFLIIAAVAFSQCASPPQSAKWKALVARLKVVEARCLLAPEILISPISEQAVEVKSDTMAVATTHRAKFDCFSKWAKENPDIAIGFLGNEVER